MTVRRRTRWPFIIAADSPTVVPPGGTSDLYTKLVAHWKLEEASGTREDSIGTNDLADNNTVTQETGKIGSCGQFVNANSEYLSIASNSVLQMGDIDFALGAWCYLDTLATRTVLAKWDNVAANEYRIRFNNSNGRFELRVSSTGADDIGCTVTATINATTWYYVIAWHDSVNNQLGISVNGTENTVAHVLGLATGAAGFNIGAFATGSSSWGGRLDEVSIWKSYIPNSTERAWLYNSGNGRSLDDIYAYGV